MAGDTTHHADDHFPQDDDRKQAEARLLSALSYTNILKSPKLNPLFAI